MDGIGFKETKNMRGVDGEIVFEDGTREIIRYDVNNQVADFSEYDDKKNIISISLPESITSIKFTAFDGCTNLKSITLPKSLEHIEDGAFFRYDSAFAFTNITVKKGNAHYKTIEGVLFTADEKKLIYYPAEKTDTEYTVSVGVETIGIAAFQSHSELVAVNIPESVTVIGSNAFSDCRNLKNITIPKGLTSLGWGAFSNCASLESIALPWGVSAIDCDTFKQCTSLRNVTITRNLTVIKDKAFFCCSRLESIDIEKDDGSLEITTYVDEMKENNDEFYKFTKNKEGFLVSKTSIGWNAFAGCHSLTTVTVPDGAYSIGKRAFSSCSNLKTVIIPKSVNYIGEDIFEGCENLKNIYYKGSVLRWWSIDKNRQNPALLEIREGEYRHLNLYHYYCDSKWYSIIKLIRGGFLWLWNDMLDSEEFKKSRVYKILMTVLIADIAYLVLGVLISIIKSMI